jgi:hypothetical protein
MLRSGYGTSPNMVAPQKSIAIGPLRTSRHFRFVSTAKIVRKCRGSLPQAWSVADAEKLGSSVRKFVRIALVVCLTVTAVPVALFASLWLWTWYRTAQVESFYRENRLVSEMRAGQKVSTNDSAPACEALLDIVPLGTDREATVAVLGREALGCQPIAESITDTRLRQRFLEACGLANIPNNGRTGKDFVDCQARTPNVLGYKQWIVDLEFDADGHLSDAGVAIWNIFL